MKASRAMKKKQAEPRSLQSIRAEIDRLDVRILKHLNQRFSLALRTRAYKPFLRDPWRERNIMARLKKRAEDLEYLSPEFVREIFGLILRESLALQRREGGRRKP